MNSNQAVSTRPVRRGAASARGSCRARNGRDAPLFEPVEREPAYTRVSAAIEQKILTRELRDGDVLPGEIDLAQQFRVHRSTVREALRQLESAGLVEASAGRETHDREPARTPRRWLRACIRRWCCTTCRSWTCGKR